MHAKLKLVATASDRLGIVGKVADGILGFIVPERTAKASGGGGGGNYHCTRVRETRRGTCEIYCCAWDPYPACGWSRCPW